MVVYISSSTGQTVPVRLVSQSVPSRPACPSIRPAHHRDHRPSWQRQSCPDRAPPTARLAIRTRWPPRSHVSKRGSWEELLLVHDPPAPAQAIPDHVRRPRPSPAPPSHSPPHLPWIPPNGNGRPRRRRPPRRLQWRSEQDGVAVRRANRRGAGRSRIAGAHHSGVCRRAVMCSIPSHPIPSRHRYCTVLPVPSHSARRAPYRGQRYPMS